MFTRNTYNGLVDNTDRSSKTQNSVCYVITIPSPEYYSILRQKLKRNQRIKVNTYKNIKEFQDRPFRAFKNS